MLPTKRYSYSQIQCSCNELYLLTIASIARLSKSQSLLVKCKAIFVQNILIFLGTKKKLYNRMYINFKQRYSLKAYKMLTLKRSKKKVSCGFSVRKVDVLPMSAVAIDLKIYSA